MSVVQITRETVTVTERRVQPDMRHVIIDVLRQQDALKRKLHELLDQLGTNGRPTTG